MRGKRSKKVRRAYYSTTTFNSPVKMKKEKDHLEIEETEETEETEESGRRLLFDRRGGRSVV